MEINFGVAHGVIMAKWDKWLLGEILFPVNEKPRKPIGNQIGWI